MNWNRLAANVLLASPTRGSRPACGLYFYGYRFYDPVTGRWPSRDPIGEEGGENLYEFINNSSLDYFDYLGLAKHHWLIQDGVSGKLWFKSLCGKDFNIDKFTTEYDPDTHKYIHGELSYNKKNNDLMASGLDCCDILSLITEFMKLIHAHLLGRNMNSPNGEADPSMPRLVGFHGQGIVSNNDAFASFVDNVCCKKSGVRSKLYQTTRLNLLSDMHRLAMEALTEKRQPSMRAPTDSEIVTVPMRTHEEQQKIDRDNEAVRNDSRWRTLIEIERKPAKNQNPYDRNRLIRGVRRDFPNSDLHPLRRDGGGQRAPAVINRNVRAPAR